MAVINLSDLSDSYDVPYCTCERVQSPGYMPTSPVYEPTSPGYMPTSPRLGTPPSSPVPPSSPLVMRRPAHVVFGLPAIPRRTAPITRRIWRERLLWTSSESRDYYTRAPRISARK